MSDYSDVKRIIDDVNANFPAKEDFWNTFCTPLIVSGLIADLEELQARNKALVKLSAYQRSRRSWWINQCNVVDNQKSELVSENDRLANEVQRITELRRLEWTRSQGLEAELSAIRNSAEGKRLGWSSMAAPALEDRP
jgi:hypothetical protein